MGKVRAPSMRKTLSGPMRTSAARSDDGNTRRRTASQKFIIVNHIAERQQHKRNRLAQVNGYGRRLCPQALRCVVAVYALLGILPGYLAGFAAADDHLRAAIRVSETLALSDTTNHVF